MDVKCLTLFFITSLQLCKGFYVPCYCAFQHDVITCPCGEKSLDTFNQKLIPKLQNLLERNYFRYFSYNIKRKKCPFWNNDSLGLCKNEACGVKTCDKNSLPPGILDHTKYEDFDCLQYQIEGTISDSTKADLANWEDYDDQLNFFCDVHEVICSKCDYIDLTVNPERFTGYSGISALKVWQAIYKQNCFLPKTEKTTYEQILTGLKCIEEPGFYRLISGLHSSISIHLTALYPSSEDSKNLPFLKPTYSPNFKDFERRFHHAKGQFWLSNLYFVYLLELKALQKASTYFESQKFYTGDKEEDDKTKELVKDIIETTEALDFPDFSVAFNDMRLLKEYQTHFKNISQILDCVGCDKCKLWGKLQITGLGTALKILFSSESYDQSLKLIRNEIVALFNALGRLSTSISQLSVFRTF